MDILLCLTGILGGYAADFLLAQRFGNLAEFLLLPLFAVWLGFWLNALLTLDCRIFRRHNWGGFHCPRHFVLFNRESLLELGAHCGLRARETSYTQGAPQWACSILGMLGLKGWLNISAARTLYSRPLYPVTCALAAAFDLARSPFMRTAQMFVVFCRIDSGKV